MLAFVGVTGARTTFSCQTANVVLYLFLCEPRNPIPKLRLPPPLAGAGHRGYEEPRGAKRSSVKSGSWVSSIAALRCRRSRPARVLRSSGCATSFARSSLSVCRSRQPNSSPFRSAVSTKRCSCLSARCTPPQRVRTSRPSIVSSRIVRELDRYHGFAAAPRSREETEAHRLPPPVQRPLALEGPSPSDSLITPQVTEKAQFGLANSER